MVDSPPKLPPEMKPKMINKYKLSNKIKTYDLGSVPLKIVLLLLIELCVDILDTGL